MNNNSKLIAPSILSSDFVNLKEDLNLFEKIGFKILHLDIMDGHFVPNITFGAPVVASIRKHTGMILDTHLMIENPDKFIVDFINAGSDIITLHVESSKNIDTLINIIKNSKVKVGICLNPNTPISTLDTMLEKIDLVLLMAVNPGFGGQPFIPSVYQKIADLKKIINSHSLNTLIEVDGGVNITNIKRVFEMGADIAVVGSAIYKAKTKVKYLKELKGTTIIPEK